jgi:hypothetical protein
VKTTRTTGWFLGAVLSGLALPGVALADVPPPVAAPAPPPAPTPPASGSAAPPAPAPPYPPPPPGYYGYPPPPYYGYPPPGYSAADFAAQRLAVLEAQIRDLQTRYDEISLVTPLVLLIGGGTLGLIGLGIYARSTCDKDQYGVPKDPACVNDRTGMDRGEVLLLVGALGVAFGAPSLIIRTARRRHIDRQIDARQIEAAALRNYAAPRLGVSPLRGGGGVVSLALDF